MQRRTATTAGAGMTLAATLLAGACSRRSQAVEPPLRVAAAADLSFAFTELGAAYEKSTGQRVVFSFGSTGLLEKQIVEGAPFDVFAAANVAFARDAAKSGACEAGSIDLYAVGRIVLFAPKGAAFAPASVADLADPRVTRIAIANPQHAPYGQAARQAMERAGVWDKLESKVAYGEDVHQALQFAQSGNADVAIVALSLAVVTPGDYVTIPMALHDRIDQALVVCTGGKAGVTSARRFAAYVASPSGRAVMDRFGFALPRESTSESQPPNPNP